MSLIRKYVCTILIIIHSIPQTSPFTLHAQALFAAPGLSTDKKITVNDSTTTLLQDTLMKKNESASLPVGAISTSVEQQVLKTDTLDATLPRDTLEGMRIIDNSDSSVNNYAMPDTTIQRTVPDSTKDTISPPRTRLRSADDFIIESRLGNKAKIGIALATTILAGGIIANVIYNKHKESLENTPERIPPPPAPPGW